MKKKDYSKLALKGITAGLLLSTPAIQAAQSAGSYLAQSCGSSGPSQGYGVQSGNSCAAAGQQRRGNSCAAAGQPQQGHYQNQQGQYSSQGNQQNQNRMQNQNNRSQNPNQLSAGCGAKGKCGAIAIGDAPTKSDNQKGYDTSYESSYDYDQNRNDSMIQSDKSKNNPQGKYLADNQMSTAQKPMTEADLLKKLDTQGKAAYNSLSPKGKALALSLANEDNGNKYPDKNLAVRIAADKTASEKKFGN